MRSIDGVAFCVDNGGHRNPPLHNVSPVPIERRLIAVPTGCGMYYG